MTQLVTAGPAQFWIRPDTMDTSVVTEVFDVDVYRLNTIDVRGANVLDGGANIGCFAVACAVRGAARVLAIEPEPENLTVLARNVGPYPQIEIVAAALTATADARPRVSGATSHAHTTTTPTDEGVEVAAITLADAIARLGHVDYLKLDIEGAERDAFRPVPSSVLAGIAHIVVEVHGPEICPWVAHDARQEIITLLSETHTVEVLPTLAGLAMLYATAKQAS